MAEIKITDLVSQSAFDQLRELDSELENIKDNYVAAAQVMLKGLKVNVKVVGDIDKLNTLVNGAMAQAAKATEQLNNAMAKQKKIVAQTTNEISRELSEIEKANAAKREQVSVDDEALKMARQVMNTYQQNVAILARVEMEMKAVTAQRKALDDQYKKGEVTMTQYQDSLQQIIARERELKGEKQEIQQRLSIEEKMNAAVSGSYKEIAQRLNLVEQAYMRLTEEEKREPFGQKLADEQIKLKQHLKDLDADMGNFQRNVGDYAIAGQSLKSELKELVLEIAQLKVQYGRMSEEEKASAEGKALEQKMNGLIEKAGELKDAMMDTNEAIKNSASDTRGIDQLLGGLGLMASGYETAKGAAEMFGISSESVEEAQKQLAAAIAVANGVQGIQNALQKQGALMQGIMVTQEKARAAAQALSTKSTVAATIAQKAFNAVAKANPYVLLATAVVSVVGAFAAFAIGAKKAKDEQKELNESINSGWEAYAKANAEIGSTIEMLDKFNGTQKEEKVIVEDLNKSLGDSFGHYKSIEEWKKALIEKSPEYLEMLKSEATAQALLNAYTATYVLLQEANAKKTEMLAQGGLKRWWNDSNGKTAEAIQNATDLQNKLDIIDKKFNEEHAKALKLKSQLQGSSSKTDNSTKKTKDDAKKAAEEEKKYQEEIDKAILQAKLEAIADERTRELAELGKTYEERFAAIKGYSEKENELRLLLSENYNTEAQKLIDSWNKEDLDKAKALEEEKKQDRIDTLESDLELAQVIRTQSYNEEMSSLKDMLAKKMISNEEYEKRSAELSRRYAIETAQAQVEVLEEALNVEGLSEDERLAITERLKDARIAAKKAENDAIIEYNKKADEDEQKKYEKRMGRISNYLNYTKEALSAVADLSGSIFDRKIEEYDKLLDKNDEQYEKEIANIEKLEESGAISSEEAERRKRAAEAKTAAASEKLTKEQNKLKYRQAIIDKTNSMAQAAISTALAILQVYSSVGNGSFISRSVMAGIMAGIGAIQLAAIAAQPIQAYKKGTDNHPGGMAIVGDGGKSEAVLFPNGKVWFTPDTPTLVDMPKGTIVLPDSNKIDVSKLNNTPLVRRNGESLAGDVIVATDISSVERGVGSVNSTLKLMMKQQARIARDQKYAAYMANRM